MIQVVIEFITSNKGSLKLLYQCFSYVKQKDLVDNVVSYECVRRRSANGTCKARIHIRDDEVVGEVGDHTHQPNPAGTETLKVVAAMKHRARTNQETPQQIIADSVTRLHPAAAAQLPTMHIRRNIRRHRQAAEHPLPVPRDRATFVIPPAHQTTKEVSYNTLLVLYTAMVLDCLHFFYTLLIWTANIFF